MGRQLGHEIQCHKMLYHVNKEKDPQILSTWRAHIRTSRFKSISWTPNIGRPQMEYTYIEHHKEGQLNHRASASSDETYNIVRRNAGKTPTSH